MSDEPCGLLKPPVWWKGKTKKPEGISVANINDYTYTKLTDQDKDVKLSELLHMDHPKKYTPGMIHRLKVLMLLGIHTSFFFFSLLK